MQHCPKCRNPGTNNDILLVNYTLMSYPNVCKWLSVSAVGTQLGPLNLPVVTILSVGTLIVNGSHPAGVVDALARTILWGCLRCSHLGNSVDTATAGMESVWIER